ncbi:ribosomal protein L22 [Myriangium duriaei CBS 260.36]|uniref:Ribosomal protein L22 n=1 Tax=Myriangium duriaei CBS 260.36 TaxID=1168546 RepID=A0A9P4MJ97_9PEZI|nr:ribosomal protein L22 [Myriangium duriaei CBS 260.36]
MSGPLRQQTLLAKNILQCHNHVSSPTRQTLPVYVQRRNASMWSRLFGGNKDKKPSSANQKAENPFLADLLSRKAKDSRSAAQQQPPQTKGDLSASSLFSTDEDLKRDEKRDQVIDSENLASIQGHRRNLQDLAVVLDPQPRKRETWQRRQVIKSLRRKERLTEEQFQRMTEREITVHSANFKTSVKKLGALARQIQGKSLEEAIVQMRFSKKKVAQEVRDQLEFARDKAIVSKGMGLGDKVEGGAVAAAVGPVDIQRKDGSRYTVTDPSKIYIDQAWVGRGPYGKLPDYRARSRVNIIRTPWTHLAVKLKEEGTLVREWEQREEKRRRQRLDKLWVPLPDRPLHGQNQYYTW